MGEVVERRRERHNLPVQLTSFVGREAQLSEAARLLQENRLLTITGAGGCGKTRFIFELGARLLESFPDGIWVAELAALADASLLTETIAAAVGIREDVNTTLQEKLFERLVGAQTLLVLDNCEHLVAACAATAEALLRACPQLTVVATSREALGVPGEVTFRLPSLSAARTRSAGIEEIADQEAVRLFIDRARLAKPGFTLNPANAVAVAEICSRLDGMPLAIELAAACVRLMPVQEILSRLENRFRLLTGGSRTALARQQTLRATVEWSYDLLDDAERALLRRLGVFAGGFTLDVVESVCSAPPVAADDILQLLGQLVDKSLVIPEQPAPSGTSRYGMLETIRQYARERLVESGEAEAVRTRHLRAFVELVEAAGQELNGPAQVTWINRLDEDGDNIRAALEWSRVTDHESEARIAAPMARHWLFRSHMNEASDALASALAHWQVRGHLRGRLLGGAAHVARAVGRVDEARALWHESIDIYRELGREEDLAEAMNGLGVAEASVDDFAAAERWFQQSHELFAKCGHTWGRSKTLNNLGQTACFTGDFDRADVLLRESLSLVHEVGDVRGIARVLETHARLALERGDYRDAEAALVESLSRADLSGDNEHANSSLASLIALAGELRAYELVMLLSGAATTLQEKVEGHLLPWWREARNRAVAEAQLHVAEPARLVERGRQMDLSALVAFIKSRPQLLGTSDLASNAIAPLTRRETEIARLVTRGYTNRQVAETLVIAERTVDAHVEHIRNKLGFHSRAQIAAWANANGLGSQTAATPA